MNRIGPIFALIAAFWLLAVTAIGQTSAPKNSGQTLEPASSTIAESPSTYVLGPQDQISIWAMDVEEISGKSFPIDAAGVVKLPMVGPIHAGGLTVQQFEAELVSRLKTYIKEPEVNVSVAELRSQPVSIIGAVAQPGVHQLQGRKTLIEMLSLAGGLRQDAGYGIKITRRLEWGRIPLPNATVDPTGQFSLAEVSVKSVIGAAKPEENILIKPQDVISVPRAEMVYVMGDVKTPGGYVLQERENVSVLQALSMAGGLVRTAQPQRAKILRPSPGAPRKEVAVDISKIIDGRNADVPLESQDILFVPNSKARSAAYRGAEAAVGAAVAITTGLTIYRR